MTEIEKIKKAIRHFESMKSDAVVVLDSGFGTHKGESNLLYRNRKMYAELAISALERQVPKKPDKKTPEYGQYVGICGCGKPVYDCNNYCPECGQRIDWSEI